MKTTKISLSNCLKNYSSHSQADLSTILLDQKALAAPKIDERQQEHIQKDRKWWCVINLMSSSNQQHTRPFQLRDYEVEESEYTQSNLGVGM
jgi:hypothetical protein